MNRKQHIAFWVGLTIVVGMALFPPRRVQTEDVRLGMGVGRDVEVYRYGFVLLTGPSAPAGPVAWDRVRRRGLVVLLVTYAFMALLRTRPREGGEGEDDGWDGRDDLPPPPEPHPVQPRREALAAV